MPWSFRFFIINCSFSSRLLNQFDRGLISAILMFPAFPRARQSRHFTAASLSGLHLFPLSRPDTNTPQIWLPMPPLHCSPRLLRRLRTLATATDEELMMLVWCCHCHRAKRTRERGRGKPPEQHTAMASFRPLLIYEDFREEERCAKHDAAVWLMIVRVMARFPEARATLRACVGECAACRRRADAASRASERIRQSISDEGWRRRADAREHCLRFHLLKIRE